MLRACAVLLFSIFCVRIRSSRVLARTHATAALSSFRDLGDPGVVDARTLQTFSVAHKGVQLCPCQTCVDGHCQNCTHNFTGSGCPDTHAFEAEMLSVTAPQDSSSSASSSVDAVHTLRLLWVTGDLVWPAFGNVTLRIYVDGESSASLAFQVYEAQALAFGWDQEEAKTYGNRYMGKGALFGGLYFAIPVPFSTSLRVTASLPQVDIDLGVSRGFFFIGRGLFGMPAFIDSNIRLPDAARLKLTRNAGTFEPHTSVVLHNSSDSGGVVFLVTLTASSAISHFLEGEVSAVVDGQMPMLLSSGTEDYFLSAQYFDAGAFHNPLSGCTHLSLGCLDKASECRMAAYRFHDADPVFWQSNISLQWQVGDKFWKVEPVDAVSMVWTYEW